MQKPNRLAKKQDFQQIYRFGKSKANRQFVVYFLKRSNQEQFRLGISISKKVAASAVVRNQMRRRVKEIIRLHEDRLVPDVDIILIVRKPALEMEYNDIQKSIFHILKKCELMQ